MLRSLTIQKETKLDYDTFDHFSMFVGVVHTCLRYVNQLTPSFVPYHE